MSLLNKKNSRFVVEHTTFCKKKLNAYFKDFESARDYAERWFNIAGWEYTIKEVKG